MADIRAFSAGAANLLHSWCDKLVELQVKSAHPRFDGGIACPACLHLHGRSFDAVWPLCFMAARTDDERYLDAARRVVAWGDNVLCDDGSYYNDAQQAWNKTTIFFLSSLTNALAYHGDELDASMRTTWESVLHRTASWVLLHFDINDPANINYHASAAGALAGYAAYTNDGDAWKRAHELARFALGFVTDDGFIYGEGRPREQVTRKGCVSVDMGYALEETLPGLVEYAWTANRNDLLSGILLHAAQKASVFVLPDGGLDNSFGTRNFKWTWWGSRTSDGMLRAYTVLSRFDKELFKVADRNLHALEASTHDGLLYGGPDYRAHGEEACVHHQFTHAKSLVGCLEPDVLEIVRKREQDAKGRVVRADAREMTAPRVQVTAYRSIGSMRLETDELVATVTASDYSHFKGGHTSGGAMSLLWHRAYGPVLACGPTDDLDREPLNMQLSRVKAEHGSSAWRLHYEKNHKPIAQIYDLAATLSPVERGIVAKFSMCDTEHEPDGVNGGSITYSIDGDGVLWWHGALVCDAPVKLQMSVVASRIISWSEHSVVLERGCALRIDSSAPLVAVRKVFSLAPGFLCAELVIDLAHSQRFSLAWRFVPTP